MLLGARCVRRARARRRAAGRGSTPAISRASASGSAGGTSAPVTPSSTSSGLPPTSVAITGRPVAIASRIVFEMPSARDGSTKQSRPRRIAGTSVRSPGSQARWATRACVEDAFDLRAQRAVADDREPHAGRRARRDGQRAHERPRQGDLVLHALEAADRAHDPQVGVVAGTAGDRGAHAVARRPEARGVDAVADAHDALARHPDRIDEVRLETLRQGDVAVDEGAIHATQQSVLPARADEIGDVPAVLAVDTDRHAGEAGGNRRLQRGQISRVNDRRPQRAEQSQQLRINLETVSVALVERVERHVVPRDPLAERGDLGERDDGMAEIARQASG